ncbi:MAG: hypothetical protein EAZ28_13885, partial [Oscillatoriales cyanobacterium]
MYDRLQTLLFILIISYLCVACQSQKSIKPISVPTVQLNPETVPVTSPIVREVLDNAIAGVAESGYETRKNARLEPKMISGILIGNWNISK